MYIYKTDAVFFGKICYSCGVRNQHQGYDRAPFLHNHIIIYSQRTFTIRESLLKLVYETYTKARIEQLFNIIIEFPDSQPALEDLRKRLKMTKKTVSNPYFNGYVITINNYHISLSGIDQKKLFKVWQIERWRIRIVTDI